MIGWFEQHKFLAYLFLLWAMSIVTLVTIRVFFFTPEISGGTAGALATVYGLPALAVGLYKWRGELLSGRGKNV